MSELNFFSNNQNKLNSRIWINEVTMLISRQPHWPQLTSATTGLNDSYFFKELRDLDDSPSAPYWPIVVPFCGMDCPIFHWYLVIFLLGAVEATIFHNRTMKSLLQCAMQSLSSWVRRDMIYLIFMTDSPLLFSCSWTHSRKYENNLLSLYSNKS